MWMGFYARIAQKVFNAFSQLMLANGHEWDNNDTLNNINNK